MHHRRQHAFLKVYSSSGYFLVQNFLFCAWFLRNGPSILYLVGINPGRFRSELVNTDERNWRLGRWWEIVIKYVVPIESVTLVVWWLVQSANVSGWYNPFSTFSLATVVLQFGVALGLFWFYNYKIAEASV